MRLRGWRHGVIPLLAVVCIGAADADVSLVNAAKKGDREGIRTLLNKRSNVNLASADGTTALHWASYRDDLESADLLIRAGAKVNAVTDVGVTPLWLASLNGSAAMTQRLLQGGADPNLALESGETPLLAAARSGAVAVVEQLIAKGANVNAKAARDQTALMWAAAQRHPDTVKALLAHGADVHARTAVRNEMMAAIPHGPPENKAFIPQGGFTPLLFAVRSGDLVSTKLIVGAGAKIDEADEWGITALAHAAHAGYLDLVNFLLETGADANAPSAPFRPLLAAVMRRDDKLAAALLDHGADPNARVPKWTPMRRNSDDFNFQPEFIGASAYWLAARVLDANTMRVLAKKGADPKFVHRVEYWMEVPGDSGNTRKQEATTALMAAVGMAGWNGKPWLVGPIAWLNGPAPTPAETQARLVEAVKAAIELGGDINAVNPEGHTALDYVQQRKNAAVVEILMANGAKPGKGGPIPPTPRK